MKKYLINYTNTIRQSLGKCGIALIVEHDKYPTTAWLSSHKEVDYIGSLVILSITEVPLDWK